MEEKKKKYIEAYAPEFVEYWNRKFYEGSDLTIDGIFKCGAMTMCRQFIHGIPRHFMTEVYMNNGTKCIKPAKPITKEDVINFHRYGKDQEKTRPKSKHRHEIYLPMTNEPEKTQPEKVQSPLFEPQPPAPPPPAPTAGVGIRLVELMNQLIEVNNEILKSNRAQYRQLTELLNEWKGTGQCTKG